MPDVPRNHQLDAEDADGPFAKDIAEDIDAQDRTCNTAASASLRFEPLHHPDGRFRLCDARADHLYRRRGVAEYAIIVFCFGIWGHKDFGYSISKNQNGDGYVCDMHEPAETEWRRVRHGFRVRRGC